MGKLEEDICCICVDPARFYSLYHKQKQFFCSSLCHQEYNSRQTDKPNLMLVQLHNSDEDPDTNADLSNFTDDRKESERKEEPFLFHVIRKGLDSAVEMFLQRQLDVNQRGKNGLTAAMVAAEIGSAEKMQMLLDNGADIVNLVDDEGETVLHKSSHWSKDTNCAELIVARAPQLVSKQDHFLQTPLHEAAGEGNVVLMKFLISEGAQVNVLDNLGRSPLHWAVIQGHTSTAETLLCYNVDEVIDLDDRFQHRPIHYAIQTCRSDVAQLLVNNNCTLDDEEAMGDSMLIYAVKNGDRPMCELMLKHSKNANDVDLQGWTALHHAVQRGDPGICQLLLTKSSAKNMPDHEHRQTPIYVAVNLCQMEIVTLLLDHGVKLFCFDDKKRSPLHYACLKGAANILRILLEHTKKSHQDGGRKLLNAKDSSGQSPLNISVSMCDRACCQVLLAHDAKVDAKSKPRLIEMGLIARKLKKSKKEKPERKTNKEKADVTQVSVPQAEAATDSLQPLFVPSKKAPTSPNSDIQWKELLEKKKRMQNAWHTWKVSDEVQDGSSYAESVAYNRHRLTPLQPEEGYLHKYTTRRNATDEPLGNELHKLPTTGSKPVSAKYGKTYSYTMDSSV